MVRGTALREFIVIILIREGGRAHVRPKGEGSERETGRASKEETLGRGPWGGLGAAPRSGRAGQPGCGWGRGMLQGGCWGTGKGCLRACRGEKGGEGVMPDGLFSPSAQRWAWGGAGVRRGWEDDPEKGEQLQQSCSVPCVECVGVGVRMGVGYVV